MTDIHAFLAVVGAVSLFILTATGIIRGLSILVDRRRAGRMAERIGKWGARPAVPSPIVAQSWPPLSTAAVLVLVVWFATMALLLGVGR